MAGTPAVFLDRDGVLSGQVLRGERLVAPSRFEDFRLLPGVPEALAALKAAGYALVVVTNQPDVSAGRMDPAELEKMHSLLRATLPLDSIKTCVHADHHQCACRKPRPGMLLEAARELGVDLARSVMVGDRWRDIEAGRAAGCRTLLIGDGYGERPVRPDWTAGSLPEAVRLILRNDAGASDRIV